MALIFNETSTSISQIICQKSLNKQIDVIAFVNELSYFMITQENALKNLFEPVLRQIWYLK